LNLVQPLTIHISYTDIDRITQGDPAVTKDLLNVFIRQNLENADKIKEYGSSGQWELLRKAAHKLKSSLALVGLNEHRLMAERLEQSAGDDAAETKRIVDELTSTILQVVAELRERVKTL
jgi:HPt (histidine-containing phosphotransfer) domain-containing protein